MLILRCTSTLLKRLHASSPGEPSEPDTTRLGEWYANDLSLAGRRYVLFLNAASRAALLVEAAPIGTVLDRFRGRLAEFLHVLGVSAGDIDGELNATSEIAIARTVDRSVVGSMVQLAKDLPLIARAHLLRLESPSVGLAEELSIDLAFYVHLTIGEAWPAHAVRGRFGLPRVGELDLGGTPPGAIAVRRAHGRDWEFSFPRVAPETMEVVYDAMERFQMGYFHRPRLELERVIRQHPECIAAINDLAYMLDEEHFANAALKLWRHAVALGRGALPDGFRVGRDHLPWGLIDNRPFLRACAGLAMKLEQSGDDGEAEKLFVDLLAMNPDDNQGMRALLVDLRLRKGDDAGALEVCDAYREDGLPSTRFGRVLALFRQGRHREARAALAVAAEALPLVGQEIARAYHFAPGLERDRVTVGGADQALHYWKDAGVAWKKTAGAVEFVASFLAESGAGGGGPAASAKVIPLRGGRVPIPAPSGEFLSEELVAALANETRRLFASNFPGVAPLLEKTDPEGTIRFGQVADRIKLTREAMGLSIKDVAARLKVPKYRVSAAEGSYASSFEPDVFWKYCELLQLEGFVRRWIDANRDTATKMGIEARPSR